MRPACLCEEGRAPQACKHYSSSCRPCMRHCELVCAMVCAMARCSGFHACPQTGFACPTQIWLQCRVSARACVACQFALPAACWGRRIAITRLCGECVEPAADGGHGECEMANQAKRAEGNRSIAFLCFHGSLGLRIAIAGRSSRSRVVANASQAARPDGAAGLVDRGPAGTTRCSEQGVPGCLQPSARPCCCRR